MSAFAPSCQVHAAARGTPPISTSSLAQEIFCRIIKLEKEEEGDESVDIVVDRRVSCSKKKSKVTRDQVSTPSTGRRRCRPQRDCAQSLTDYGAFVDIGGMDGLLHISDLAWSRVASPSDVLTVRAADSRSRFSRSIRRPASASRLGLKQLQPHPWDAVP